MRFQVIALYVSTLISILISQNALGQRTKDEIKHLAGITVGYNHMSVPLSMDSYVNTGAYDDYSVGVMYMRSRPLSPTYSADVIASVVGSSVSPLISSGFERGQKIIIPVEYRLFWGGPRLAFYGNAGVQYNCLILKGNGIDAHQLSANVTAGARILRYVILGLKYHFPILNSSVYDTNPESIGMIDYSCDKSGLMLEAGVGVPVGRHFLLMADYDFHFPDPKSHMPIASSGIEREPLSGKRKSSNSHTLNISFLYVF